MNSRLRWRSLTSAWTFPEAGRFREQAQRAMTFVLDLVWKLAWTPGLGGKSVSWL